MSLIGLGIRLPDGSIRELIQIESPKWLNEENVHDSRFGLTFKDYRGTTSFIELKKVV